MHVLSPVITDTETRIVLFMIDGILEAANSEKHERGQQILSDMEDFMKVLKPDHLEDFVQNQEMKKR